MVYEYFGKELKSEIDVRKIFPALAITHPNRFCNVHLPTQPDLVQSPLGEVSSRAWRSWFCTLLTLRRSPNWDIPTGTPKRRLPPWVSTGGKRFCYRYQFSLCKLQQDLKVRRQISRSFFDETRKHFDLILSINQRIRTVFSDKIKMQLPSLYQCDIYMFVCYLYNNAHFTAKVYTYECTFCLGQVNCNVVHTPDSVTIVILYFMILLQDRFERSENSLFCHHLSFEVPVKKPFKTCYQQWFGQSTCIKSDNSVRGENLFWNFLFHPESKKMEKNMSESNERK